MAGAEDLLKFAKSLKDKTYRYYEELYVEIIKLANAYLDIFDAAMGLPERKEANTLFKWELSHAHSVVDICDENATKDIGFGEGVYPEHAIPKFPAHINCHCQLKSLLEESGTIEQSRWQVIINGKNIKFTNESTLYSAKKEGTADDFEVVGAERKLTKVGKEPEDFDTPIYNAFLAELDVLTKTVGDRIYRE